MKLIDIGSQSQDRQNINVKKGERIQQTQNVLLKEK